MSTSLTTLVQPITPTNLEKRIAQQARQTLAPLLHGDAEAVLRVQPIGGEATEIVLPHAATKLLFDALEEMALGNSVTLLPSDAELTTQQAADLVRVSRPFLIKLLEEGKLPYRKVGAHRRVRYQDVVHYIQEEEARRVRVMEALVAETERLGLYE